MLIGYSALLVKNSGMDIAPIIPMNLSLVFITDAKSIDMAVKPMLA